MSYHRTEVKIRPILWGISLQLLFALIILKEDMGSFIGMCILGSLIITYMMRGEKEPQKSIGYFVIVLFVNFIIIWLLNNAISLNANIPLFIFVIVIVLTIINYFLKIEPSLQKYFISILLLNGISLLILNDLHGKVIVEIFSTKVKSFLELSDWGAKFLFANLADEKFFGSWKEGFPNKGTWPGFGFQFGFKVLPTIIFFGGFMSVLYYFGIMQKVIQTISRFMRWTIGTSGAETLSCSANIFVGQTEAPLLIKPFLEKMTTSELLTIMVGGFATIAGGVLAGYIAMGVPAGHLIAASVMSAPAALVVGKIIFPEMEHSQTAGDVALPEFDVGSNAIEAASNGITDGLKLAVNVGAMLIGFIALIAVLDVILNWLDSIIDGSLLNGIYAAYDSSGLSPVKGEYSGFFPGSLRTFFGTILSPLAYMMGVPWNDAAQVGNLLGIKLSLNEFVAFGTLGDYINKGLISERAIIISTYALCGFANFSSIGIQIGGISAIAPS